MRCEEISVVFGSKVGLYMQLICSFVFMCLPIESMETTFYSNIIIHNIVYLTTFSSLWITHKQTSIDGHVGRNHSL